MKIMDRFTLEQVCDFIRIAMEKGAHNVLAELIAYKEEFFSDYDPMEAFILE